MAFNKLITYIGHFFMLVLLFLSVYFYQERMLHTDNAYGIFTIINTENFNLPHYRYPLVLTQFLPVLAIQFGASIKTVIIAYSANFYLLYYACFLVSLVVYKNIKTTLFVLLSLVVTTKEIFFLQTEIAHGVIFSALFYAWLNYTTITLNNFKKLGHYIIGVLIFLIAVLFHPLSALFTGFILVWNLVEHRKWFDVKTLLFLVLVFVVLVVKVKITPSGSYEDSFYQNKDMLWHSLINIKDSYVLRFFIKRLHELYLLPTLMLLVSLVWYFVKKQWIKLLLLLFASIGYVAFASLMFKGDSDIMTERIFLLYGAIVSLGFVHVLFEAYNYFKAKKAPYILALIVAGCTTAGIVKILEASVKYNYRLSLVKQQAVTAQNQNGTKFYVLNNHINFPFSTWANACEQLLYSALHFSKNKTVYVFNDEESKQNILSQTKQDMFLMVAFYLIVNDTHLNKKYFSLNPDFYSQLKLN